MIVIDGNLLELIQNKINSFIKWDLVHFFHNNPHTKNTAENIAKFTGRDAKTTERELEGLVEAEILVVETMSQVRVYGLVEDEQIRQTIHAFIEACHEREFRVEAIQHVIQGMQFSPRHDF